MVHVDRRNDMIHIMAGPERTTSDCCLAWYVRSSRSDTSEFQRNTWYCSRAQGHEAHNEAIQTTHLVYYYYYYYYYYYFIFAGSTVYSSSYFCNSDTFFFRYTNKCPLCAWQRGPGLAAFSRRFVLGMFGEFGVRGCF